MNSKGQTSIIIAGVVVLIIILGSIAYFMAQRGETSIKNDDMAEEMQSTPTATVAPSDADSQNAMMKSEGKKVTIEVTGSPFKFAPSTISVNQGDIVTIKFINASGMHDFVIDELGVKTSVIGTGKTEEVTFVADKKGSYKYYCSVDDHRQMGMEGTLTVK